MNSNMIPPHGGCGLVNRIVPEDEIEAFIEKAKKCKSYSITDGDLSMFYRIADGTLSPLHGGMNKAEFNRVLEKETIERKGKAYAWAIPMAFPITDDEWELFGAGETVAVRDQRDVIVGTIEISDIYQFDKDKYNMAVYGTERQDHPGPRIVNNDSRQYLMGGEILALPEIKSKEFGQYMLSPKQSRELFEQKKWERTLAFQTRNPLHRAQKRAEVFRYDLRSFRGLLRAT